MGAMVDLPREQRAVLSLVLGKGRSYAQIAELLRIDETAVRERAHAALEELGPRDGTPPPPPRRVEVGDYLLSQQGSTEAKATRDYLGGSAVGRAWARALATELRPVAEAELPEIPQPSTPSSGPPPRSAKQPQAGAATVDRTPSGAAVSRRGGAILLGALAVIAVIVVLLTSGGGGSSGKSSSRKPSRSTTTPAVATKVLGQVNLTPAANHPSGAAGVATLLQQGTTNGIALQVTGLPATSSKFAYAVWLYNSGTDAERIGFAPAVKSDGKLGAVAPTPPDLGKFRALILTRETNPRASRPGTIVLAGELPKHG
ncbi:MAG: RNA polymerase sigma factor [Solirubrobacteraceae bacterium]